MSYPLFCLIKEERNVRGGGGGGRGTGHVQYIDGQYNCVMVCTVQEVRGQENLAPAGDGLRAGQLSLHLPPLHRLQVG